MLGINKRLKASTIHKVNELRGDRSPRDRLRLAETMFLCGDVEERFVFGDRTAERATKLIANQVVLYATCIREPVLGSQGLHPVVFEQRAVPLIGSTLQNSVGHKPAHLAVFGAEVMRNDAIFFDRIGRN